jgi:hypothetical protein
VIIFKIDFILVKYIDTNDINMVTIYTDGSCLKNPGPGGWAFCIVDDSDSYTCMSGSESNTTNNRMELTAIIESLAMIQDNECNIYSDSLLTINCAQNIWKRKANLDLWNKYDYHDFELIGEPYFDIDFNSLFYLTDTGRSWDGAKFSIRDNVSTNFKQKFSSSDDIIKAALKNNFPNQIMFTFHIYSKLIFLFVLFT